MGRIEHRHPLARQPLDALENCVAALRIDADGRLIQDQQTRTVQQPDPDVQPPLHPAGEVLGLLARPICQTHHAEHLLHTSMGYVRGQSVQAGEELKVLTGAQVGVDRELLRHIANRGLLGDAMGSQPLAGDEHLAGIRLEQPAHHRDGRRLASAIWAQQAERLTLGDLETDAANSLDLTKPLV